MKDETTAGQVWLTTFIIAGMVFIAMAFFVGGFTHLSLTARQVTTPLVACPPESSAQVDVPSMYVDSNGYISPYIANKFICYYSNGTIAADKTKEQVNLWQYILSALSLLPDAVFSSILAALYAVSHKPARKAGRRI